MSKKEVMNKNIQPYNLTNKQIKEKIENAIAYDHSKYKNTEILFEKKNSNVYKLPFSDFKVAISQELDEQKMLIKELEDFTLLEENVEIQDDFEQFMQEATIEDDDEIDVLDEIYDFDDDGKKPGKQRYRSKIKKVDTLAIIEKIKAEAREKNKGKKVTTRKDINKELKPYMLKKNSTNGINDDTLTSIDIYLNAVNKIETNTSDNSEETTPLELNLDEILNDLEK